jgi:ABC-type multidrug transport system fused ATPase/permease subunit
MTEEILKPSGFNAKILLKYLKPYKKEFFVLGFLGIISAFANGLVPLVIGRFFDALLKLPTEPKDLPSFLPVWVALLIAWVGLQLIANVIDYVMSIRRNYLSEKSYANLLTQSFGHLISLPISFFKEHRIGDTQDRVSRAANDVDQMVSNVLIDLGPQFLTLLIGIFIVSSINISLAGLLMIGMLLYILTLIRVVPPVAVLQKESRKAYGDASSTTYEGLSHFELIKQTTTEQHSKEKVAWHYFSDVLPKALRATTVWVKINRSQRAIVVITQLVVFIFSVGLIRNGSLSIGELVAVNSYAGMIFGPFASVGRNWMAIQNVSVSLERIDEYLTLETEEEKDKNKKEINETSGQISFEDVSFSYKEDGPAVLNNISFTVLPGQVVALVGQSGVGKSTIVQLLSGYYAPSQGIVKIDNTDLGEIKRSSLRQHIAVVPQEVVLFNDSVLNNIRYGSFKATLEEVQEAAKEAHADTFIEQFPEKYDQLVGERGIKLSVGEKQRVAIARAILRNPKILILDEPTSALDPQTERNITDSLEKLMRGRTTFIIAHRLSTVRRADKIFVFDKGAIAEEGTHEELLAKNSLYRKLHDLHIGLS